MGGFAFQPMAGAIKKFGGAQQWKKQPGAITQSGTGGPSQGAGGGWGGGAMAGGGRLGKFAGGLRRAKMAQRPQPQPQAPAGTPSEGGSTRGRRGRRQRARRAQMGRPQPPAQTTAPASNVDQPFDPTLMTDPTTGAQYPPGTTGRPGAINLPGQPPPPPSNVGGFGGGLGQTGLWNPADSAAGSFGQQPPAPASISRQDFQTGGNMLRPDAAAGFAPAPPAGPAPMAPPPGPGGEIAPIGGEDPRRFRGRPGGGGGWGGVLNVGR